MAQSTAYGNARANGRAGNGGIRLAATQGHGNPNWTRDETLLALHLYQLLGGQVPGPDDPRIIALSQRLRALPVHQAAGKRESFRNPAGVGFKLQNIRQVATGRGLGNVSALDRAVWQEFGAAPELVQRLVEAIGIGIVAGGIDETDVAAVEADEEFVEGRILTAVHRRRERNPRLRERLIAKRREAAALRCECCGDGPKVPRPELGLAGFEVHHVVPLAQSTGTATRLADLALLCATCHRLIHRAMHMQRRWIGVPELRSMLGRPS